MIDPKTIQEGEWLWDKQRRRLGNTTMSRVVWYRVKVVQLEEHGATVRFNGNRHLPEHYSWRRLAKLQRRRRIDGKLVGAKP